MANTKKFDISNELMVQRFKNGIRLFRPDSLEPIESRQNISQLFKIPLNVFFTDADSYIKAINETTAQSCNFTSAKDAYGRSIRETAKKETVASCIQHSVDVMNSAKMIIQEETFQLNADEDSHKRLAIKFPWYGDSNKIIGVFGFSFTVNPKKSGSISHALLSIFQTGLITPNILSNTDSLLLPQS